MRSVLLVDDDEEMCELASQALAKRGFSVEYRTSVDGVVELIGGRPFDVVVTDLELGAGGGGLALCEELRARSAALPVIVVTAHTEAAEAARSVGANRVLVKPVDMDDLARALSDVLAPDAVTTK